MYFSVNPLQPMSTLPLQIFTYISSPFKEWQDLAWAGALVLIIISTLANLFSKWHLIKWKGKHHD
jgi:phosphate transport system permease protein